MNPRIAVVSFPLKLRVTILALASIGLLLFLSGCAVRLAPSYNSSIMEGLTAANQQTMTLFASVSDGTSPGGFAQREGQYSAIVGKFDALRVQAAARPFPRSLASRIFGAAPPADADPGEIPVPDQAPSIRAMQGVVDTLTRMRDHDRNRGLSVAVVPGYKSAYEILIQQALTYEAALER